MLVRIAAVLCSVVAIALPGCGGDDNGAEGSSGVTDPIETSDLSKAEFIKRANEICIKGSEELFERLSVYMQKNESGSSDRNELAADGLRHAVLPAVEEQLEEIQGLGAPAGDEEEIEEFLAAQSRAVDSLQQRRRVALATDIGPAFKRAGQLANQYGIQGCNYG